ncbi:multiple sugar transport system substrate-binding protein [Breznakia sp. PF5-3]|uniref:ABC transporter substrate-binding protein n=1 Tax=unclassified Breznakia TaxID=2623764 RepID=UPI0024050787|nr:MULTISPECIES: sugar ABC transporter substrate-binding protein [unclassified Breznakia]MDF9824859.1 multiple sugar transport system substrate-binding protein [Breznakia sp. PM6-1]MDF9835716.1 multiple sugar transport system substrate-binding protein [Breznakia sp. PF5-3]MDF9838276.1 multiple sugar transport system substrate-binding protein [Breznakia sp. PFB2-8]MDF9860285.1 multiple sugar transport system substrate-binding protein [Breznakia sp. PH5-24]
MKRKYIISIIAIAICLCVGVGYAIIQSSHKVITIGVFAGSNWDVPTADSYQIVQNVIERYEKEHPNVRVKFMSGIRKSDYSEWLAGETLNGDAPDIFFVLSDDFTTFHQVGLLENLDSYIANDNNFDTEAYYPSSYATGMDNNHMYALPYESVPNLVFVNKSLLEKEGISLPNNNWTWNDFYEICKKVSKDTDNDGKIDQFGVYGYTWEDAMFANGIALFDEKEDVNDFNNTNAIESIRFLRQLNELNDNVHVTSQMFDEGNVAFCIMPFSEYRTYKPYPWKVKKYSNFEWDCVMLPSGPNGDNISKVDTLLIGMNAQSKHKDEAWELLKLLSYDQQTQLEIFKHSQGVSVLREITKSEEAIDIISSDTPGDSLFQMYLLNEVMENGKTQYRFKKFESVTSLIDNEIYRIINSESDIKTEMVSLQNKIETSLKE